MQALRPAVAQGLTATQTTRPRATPEDTMTVITPAILATLTIDGRDYEVFRVGGCQVNIRAGGEQCTACGLDHWWNVWGIAPQFTHAELALPDPKRPRLPYAYASPVRPCAQTQHLGHPGAPVSDGWQIHDEMNRVVFGYAATFEEIAEIAAQGLRLPV